MSASGKSKLLSQSGFASIVLALIAATLTLITASASASSKTLFVSKSGNDSNAGTQQAPFLNISAAITASGAGDTIEISAGEYVETLTIDKALTIRCANAGISAGATPGTRGTETVIEGQVTVTAVGTVIDGCHFVRPAGLDQLTSVPKLISSNVAGEVTVQNSKLDMTLPGSVTESSPNGLSACGSGASGTAEWRVYNNELRNIRYTGCTPEANLYQSRAVFADFGRRIVVYGNSFFNTGQGIYITGFTADGSEIRGNLFTRLGTAGVFLGAPQNVVISGNTFEGYGGVYLSDSVNTIIENNLFKSSNWFALQVDDNATDTIMRNNAILGAYPSGYGDFTGKTIFVNSSNTVTATSNWWGDGRLPSALIGGSNPESVTFDPTLTFEGTVDTSAIGFFPPGSSGDGTSELTASHTVTYTVATTRSLSVENIDDPGSGSTTVAFGGVPQTGERQITQVRLKFTADDAINENSRVKITATLNSNTADNVTLNISAGNISSNGDYTALPQSAVSLNNSSSDVITGIYGVSGVTNATSNLTYRLETTGASEAASETKTITYTLADN